MLNRVMNEVFCVSFCFVFAHGAEHKVTHDELPPAVQRVADEQSKGATVRGYSTETENGQKQYEVELTVNGHSKDVILGPDGKVLEIEEAVRVASLSQAVQAGLKAKAGKGQITKIESLTKGGKIVAYEAQVMTEGKRSEIQVGPDGKSVAREE